MTSSRDRRLRPVYLGLGLLLALPCAAAYGEPLSHRAVSSTAAPSVPWFVFGKRADNLWPLAVTIRSDGHVTGFWTVTKGGRTEAKPEVRLSRGVLDGLMTLARAEGFFTMPGRIQGTGAANAPARFIMIRNGSVLKTVDAVRLAHTPAFDQLYAVLLAVVGVPCSVHRRCYAEPSPATTREVINHTLGFALRVPSTWSALSRAPGAPLGVTFVRSGKTPPPARLAVEILGNMRIGTPERVAQLYACGLTRTAPGTPVIQAPVMYAGTRGVMLSGMPSLADTVQIILVHDSVVYNFVALAPVTTEEKATLASLRWVPITPKSPVLRAPSLVKPCT